LATVTGRRLPRTFRPTAIVSYRLRLTNIGPLRIARLTVGPKLPTSLSPHLRATCRGIKKRCGRRRHGGTAPSGPDRPTPCAPCQFRTRLHSVGNRGTPRTVTPARGAFLIAHCQACLQPGFVARIDVICRTDTTRLEPQRNPARPDQSARRPRSPSNGRNQCFACRFSGTDSSNPS